jgi:hypothetical protein
VKIKFIGIFCAIALFSSLTLFFYSFRTPQRELPVETVDSTVIQALAELSMNKFQNNPEKISTTFTAAPSKISTKKDSLDNARFKNDSIDLRSTSLVKKGSISKPFKSKNTAFKVAKKVQNSSEEMNSIGPDRMNTISNDTSEMMLAIAQKLYDQKDFKQAVKLYRKILRLNFSNLRRIDIIRECIYGEAKCSRELISIGRIDTVEFVTAWRAVQGTFPADSPEKREAIIFLNNIPK